MREPLVIAVAADNFFAMPLAVTIRSALENLGPERKASIWVLSGEISTQNRHMIVNSIRDLAAEISFCECTTSEYWQAYIRSESNYPPSSYFRLSLAEFLPDSLHKAIYLDSDLVVRHDLGDLWDLPLCDCHLLAAIDAANRRLGWPGHLDHLNLTSWNLSAHQKYLQSGVLVVNLEKWRNDEVFKRLIYFIKRHTELPYPDMDALNIVLGNNWREIDPRWNQLPCVFDFPSAAASPYTDNEFESVKEDPFIVHFGSRPKPWEPGCMHPYREEWFNYLARTEWRGWRSSETRHVLKRFKQAMRRASKLMAGAFLRR